MAEVNGWSVPKDENGKAYYSYRKVTFWINSTENFKYIIKGDLDYRPDIIEGRPVPVSSEFTDWKTGIKYIMRNDGWAILPGSGGGGGGDITRAEVVAMDEEVLQEAKEYADNKQKKLVAGTNITITDGPGEDEQTINASGEAGGIYFVEITNTKIVDEVVVPDLAESDITLILSKITANAQYVAVRVDNKEIYPVAYAVDDTSTAYKIGLSDPNSECMISYTKATGSSEVEVKVVKISKVDVTKTYVDEQDTKTLNDAKEYAESIAANVVVEVTDSKTVEGITVPDLTYTQVTDIYANVESKKHIRIKFTGTAVTYGEVIAASDVTGGSESDNILSIALIDTLNKAMIVYSADGESSTVSVSVVKPGGASIDQYLKSIAKNEEAQTITIADDKGTEVSFPYGSGSGSGAYFVSTTETKEVEGIVVPNLATFMTTIKQKLTSSVPVYVSLTSAVKVYPVIYCHSDNTTQTIKAGLIDVDNSCIIDYLYNTSGEDLVISINKFVPDAYLKSVEKNAEGKYLAFYDKSNNLTKLEINDLLNVSEEPVAAAAPLYTTGGQLKGATPTENAHLVNKEYSDAKTSELHYDEINVSIAAASWDDQAEVQSPFTCKAEAASSVDLSDYGIVELVNNKPVEFANYGIQLLDAASNTATFIALVKPTEDISFKLLARKVI